MAEVDLAYVHAAVRAARQPVEEVATVEVQPLQLGIPVGDDLREEAVLPDVVVEVGAEALRRLLVVLVLALQQGREAGNGGESNRYSSACSFSHLDCEPAAFSLAAKYAAANSSISCPDRIPACMTRL